MKTYLFLLSLVLPLLLNGQSKVKFVNIVSTELDYPMLSFSEDIKTYSVHAHLHDFIDDYEWSQDKVLKDLTPLRNFEQKNDESDIYVHLDYYIQKEMSNEGEVINAPIKLTIIDGAGKSIYSDFVLSDNKAAVATASSTHSDIVAKVKSHLEASTPKVDSYMSRLFDGQEFTVGANTGFFTTKKASDADQVKFDEAINLFKEKIAGKVVSRNVLNQCAAATDFWKKGLKSYDKSSAEYLVCGANLFYVALKANDPQAAQSYFDLVKDIDNAWTPKENILKTELASSENSTFYEATAFSVGGKSAAAGDSGKMEATGKLKLESGNSVEGKITFTLDSEGEVKSIVVFQSLNDKQEYGLHQVKGGYYGDVRFAKVETKRGDELYTIVEAAGNWQVLRPMGDSGNSLLAIGNIETEKSYHFVGELKMNPKIKELFGKNCPVVSEGADNKKYGRKLTDFVALIKDLDSCK